MSWLSVERRAGPRGCIEAHAALHVKHHVSEYFTILWGGLSAVVNCRISLLEVATKALEEGHQVMSHER